LGSAAPSTHWFVDVEPLFWKDFVVQNIGYRESGFIRVNLGETDVGMSINGRLLVDFATLNLLYF